MAETAWTLQTAARPYSRKMALSEEVVSVAAVLREQGSRPADLHPRI
jgi:hypothetical protein